MRTLNRENLLDILYGCTILGTGGGGSLDEGIEMIDEALNLGKEFKLASFDDLKPDDIIGTPYACGAISPLTEEEIRKYARLKETEESFYILCMNTLENDTRQTTLMPYMCFMAAMMCQERGQIKKINGNLRRYISFLSQ